MISSAAQIVAFLLAFAQLAQANSCAANTNVCKTAISATAVPIPFQMENDSTIIPAGQMVRVSAGPLLQRCTEPRTTISGHPVTVAQTGYTIFSVSIISPILADAKNVEIALYNKYDSTPIHCNSPITVDTTNTCATALTCFSHAINDDYLGVSITNKTGEDVTFNTCDIMIAAKCDTDPFDTAVTTGDNAPPFKIPRNPIHCLFAIANERMYPRESNLTGTFVTSGSQTPAEVIAAAQASNLLAPVTQAEADACPSDTISLNVGYAFEDATAEASLGLTYSNTDAIQCEASTVELSPCGELVQCQIAKQAEPIKLVFTESAASSKTSKIVVRVRRGCYTPPKTICPLVEQLPLKVAVRPALVAATPAPITLVADTSDFAHCSLATHYPYFRVNISSRITSETTGTPSNIELSFPVVGEDAPLIQCLSEISTAPGCSASLSCYIPTDFSANTISIPAQLTYAFQLSANQYEVSYSIECVRKNPLRSTPLYAHTTEGLGYVNHADWTTDAYPFTESARFNVPISLAHRDLFFNDAFKAPTAFEIEQCGEDYAVAVDMAFSVANDKAVDISFTNKATGTATPIECDGVSFESDKQNVKTAYYTNCILPANAKPAFFIKKVATPAASTQNEIPLPVSYPKDDVFVSYRIARRCSPVEKITPPTDKEASMGPTDSAFMYAPGLLLPIITPLLLLF